ncbi:MAG: RNA methyltransferase [Alphaproteobacteria bacterium]|nr:RNA methyltransferase [Alphaproteobacteria bacterium]
MFKSQKKLTLKFDIFFDELKEGQQFSKVFAWERMPAIRKRNIHELSKNHGFPLVFVPIEKLKSLTNLPVQDGIVALKTSLSFQSLQNVIDLCYENAQTPLFLMLNGVTDVRNIGAIARTAYGLGVHGLILNLKNAAALNDDAIETSAGYLQNLQLIRSHDILKTAEELKLNGIHLVAAHHRAQQTIFELKGNIPLCLILGDEHAGVGVALLKIVDQQIKIQMQNNVESFNVSVACGIFLYEIIKQRLQL